MNSISNSKENTKKYYYKTNFHSDSHRKNYKNNINNNADQIYIDIINYYKIEKEITTKINNKNTLSEKYEGFLVDEYWFENWKKYSFYDFINIKYLQKNIEDKNTIISYIKKKQEKTNLNYCELNDIENFLIENANKIKEEKNINKTFVIINQEFLNSFKGYIQKDIYHINFYLSYHNIQIRLHGSPSLDFTSFNNLINWYL